MNPSLTNIRMPARLEGVWLSGYLNRELAAEEAAWFEGYIIDKPDLLAALECDNALRDAIAATGTGRNQSEAQTTAAPQSVAKVESRRGRVRQPAWLSVAASLAAGVLIGSLGFRMFLYDQSKSIHPQEKAAIPIPSRVVFDSPRSGGQEVAMEKTIDGSPILVEIAIPASESINLVRAGGATTKMTRNKGFVSFVLDLDEVRNGQPIFLQHWDEGKETWTVCSLKEPASCQSVVVY
jgi:hypothetical protein